MKVVHYKIRNKVTGLYSKGTSYNQWNAKGKTFDTWIGEAERRKLGNTFWSRRIRDMVFEMRPVFLWDRLYIGGGNARRINDLVLRQLGDDVVIVPNTAGITGGVRAWEL